MDKRKVIEAYRRGFLTLQECAQVLGVEKSQLTGVLSTQAGLQRDHASANHSLLQATNER